MKLSEKIAKELYGTRIPEWRYVSTIIQKKYKHKAQKILAIIRQDMRATDMKLGIIEMSNVLNFLED